MNARKIISPLSQLISQKSLMAITGRTLLLPFYHAVSDDPLPYISNLYPLKSVSQFERELDYFCKYFIPASIDEIHENVTRTGKKDKALFHLTFDDGLKEVYTVIAPILEARNIPATFFINTNFVENKDLFYRYKVGLIVEKLKVMKDDKIKSEVANILNIESSTNEGIISGMLTLKYADTDLIDKIASVMNIDFKSWLEDHRPYMSVEQIEDLIDRGFSIGSHSKDHPRFNQITEDEQKSQFTESFDFLEKHFKIANRFFSFPFSDDGVKKVFFDWMYEAGNCSLSFGVSGLKDDYKRNHLHRIPMDECTSDPEQFIKSEYAYYMLKGLFNKNKIRRQ